MDGLVDVPDLIDERDLAELGVHVRAMALAPRNPLPLAAKRVFLIALALAMSLGEYKRRPVESRAGVKRPRRS